MKLSRCGELLAFTLEAGDGSERHSGHVRDLRTGATRQLPALDGCVSVEWAADGRALLYTQPNELGRPWRALRCEVDSLGSAAGGAPLAGWGRSAAARAGGAGAGEVVWEEQDERFFLEIGRTKDWAHLTLNANSKTASEVRLLPPDLRLGGGGRGGGANMGGTARVVQPRREGLEYFVEHAGGQLYVLGTDPLRAPDYAVLRSGGGARGSASGGQAGGALPLCSSCCWWCTEQLVGCSHAHSAPLPPPGVGPPSHHPRMASIPLLRARLQGPRRRAAGRGALAAGVGAARGHMRGGHGCVRLSAGSVPARGGAAARRRAAPRP